MSKLLAGIIAALFVGVGVAAASSLTSRDDSPTPTGSVSTLDSTASTGTTDTGEDISGPCDEAEHATDPRCTGSATDGATTGGTTTGDDDRGRGFREPGEDISGPCDEAEHANDPRCVGGALDDDRGGNSGPGRSGADDDEDDDHGGRGHDDGAGGDRSGSNSGRG
jgi:hypothetical protein